MHTLQDHEIVSLIMGYRVSSSGEITSIKWADVCSSTAEQAGTRTWLHLNRLSQGAKDWLEGEGELDPIIVSVLFSKKTQGHKAPKR